MTSSINIKRILISLGMLTFVGALVWGATGAFFNDTEKSTGNTFSAGDIDLKIDNTSYVTNATGTLVASPANSWALSDLTNQLFFSFDDIKPGDIGEDTISVHPGSNDAWACMAANMTSTPDNGITEPEADANDVTDGPTGGELQNFLNFTFWKDDGDNVFEAGETVIPALTGPASQIFNGTWLPIADSAGSSSPLAGDSTSYIGKAWCFGTLTPNNTAQDGNGSSTPLTRGTTGFTCSGTGNNNIAQTDGIVVDVGFYAEQARNNRAFLCSSVPPMGTTTVGTTTLTVTKVIVPGNDATPAVASDFSFSVDGAPAIQFEADASNAVLVGPGTHNVLEVASSSGYTATYTNCTNVSGPATCTITNTFGSATTTIPVTADTLNGWSWYDDTNDVINNALGTFVLGPGDPPLGNGSASTTLAAANSRVYLQTNSYGGVTLASLTQLAFTEWSDGTLVAGPTEAPFVRFNVDFGTSTAFQKSLVYVPSVNGAIVKDSWQSWDMINGGTALWCWSGMTLCGGTATTWPTEIGVAFSNASQDLQTWNDIKAAYPGIKMHALFPQVGVRVGEPGPAGYTGNMDSFTIATGGPATTYDFGN